MSEPGPSFHVAIIMDGNGRWAQTRGLPRIAGHREGGKAVRRVVEAAPELGITTLTLYAFSADNWHRPSDEVRSLMRTFERYLRDETQRCVERGLRVRVIGRRDRIAASLRAAIETTETATRGCRGLELRIAVDYSGREAIVEAARACRSRPAITPMDFAHELGKAIHSDPRSPDVDLLIRTSGEQRLSDFLLWEVAYAEMLFTERLWPDFDAADLARAVEAFHRRDRRFGRLPERREAGPR